MKTLTLDAGTAKALEEAAKTVCNAEPYGWLDTMSPERTIALYAIQAVAEAIVKHGPIQADTLKGLKVRLEEPDAFEADLEALLVKRNFSPPL
ncbi:MAG: hypothetical protein WCI03_03725 [bacterium]